MGGLRIRTLSGVLALAGAALMALGGWLPYATVGDQEYHVFERSSPHGVLWFAVEPAAVIVVAVVIGVMLVRDRPLGLPWAAVLATCGSQTILYFLGFVGFYSQTGEGTHADSGGWVGMLGAALVAGAGAAMIQRRSELTGEAQPAGWYGDPTEPGRLRYWSGSAWTGHTHAPLERPGGES